MFSQWPNWRGNKAVGGKYVNNPTAQHDHWHPKCSLILIGTKIGHIQRKKEGPLRICEMIWQFLSGSGAVHILDGLSLLYSHFSIDVSSLESLLCTV